MGALVPNLVSLLIMPLGIEFVPVVNSSIMIGGIAFISFYYFAKSENIAVAAGATLLLALARPLYIDDYLVYRFAFMIAFLGCLVFVRHQSQGRLDSLVKTRFEEVPAI